MSRSNRKIENHYPTLALDDIKAIDVPAKPDSVLFLWATSPKLLDAMEVIAAWGFLYRTCAVWVKDRIGMGYYFRQQHELLLVSRMGTPGAPETQDRPSSIIEYPRCAHSAKPVLAHEIIERMYPNARRLEMFARRPREGWDLWGNESEGRLSGQTEMVV